MHLFIYIGASILVLGIGAVIWLFLSDKKTSAQNPPKTPKTANGLLTTSQILMQLGLNEDPELPIEPSPGRKGEASRHQGDQPPSPQGLVLDSPRSPKTQGTASLRLEAEGSDNESEKRLAAQNEQLKRDITEMQSKNEKQEALLEEKNKEIEHVTKDLEIELKSRKEFNKIKDILEKELKDSKEKNRSLQIDLTQTQTEADSYLKRVKQLEEKINKFDVEVREKTDQLKEQQVEVEQHKKKLETLDKKLKGYDPVIVEKDRKINSLVPLLKDLPEGFPDNQTQKPDQAVSPANIVPPPTQSQEGGGPGGSPAMRTERILEEQDSKNNKPKGVEATPAAVPAKIHQSPGQIPPTITGPQGDAPGKDSPKEEPPQPTHPSSTPETKAAKQLTPAPESVTGQPKLCDSSRQPSVKPLRIDDVDRIRLLASAEAINPTPPNLSKITETNQGKVNQISQDMPKTSADKNIVSESPVISAELGTAPSRPVEEKESSQIKTAVETPIISNDSEKSRDRTPKDLLNTIEADISHSHPPLGPDIVAQDMGQKSQKDGHKEEPSVKNNTGSATGPDNNEKGKPASGKSSQQEEH